MKYLPNIEMDALCTPTVATAAAFTSLLILDLFRRDFELLPGHMFFGVLSVAGMAILCQRGATFAAWGLFLLPFVLVITAFTFTTVDTELANHYKTQQVNPANMRSRVCNYCKQPSCACPK
jgi:hypothetical protein